MQFTEKEITLAKQLKEAGFEWIPAFGDVVIFHNDVMVVWYSVGKFIVCIPQEVESRIDEKGEFHYQEHYNLVPDDVVWLPLWHQCRRIFKKANIELTISDMPRGTEVTLTLWKRCADGSLEFYQQISADTDLEAMYQAIGRLHNERN